jgi:hypothetical protein
MRSVSFIPPQWLILVSLCDAEKCFIFKGKSCQLLSKAFNRFFFKFETQHKIVNLNSKLIFLFLLKRHGG